MRRMSPVRTLAPALLLLLLSASSALAAIDSYLLKTMPSNTDWSVASGYWSQGAGAGPGYNYYVGRDAAGNIPSDVTYPAGAPVEVRTPVSATPISFPGDSLTIDTSGSLKIKTAANITFPDLRFRGTRPNFFCGDAAIKTFDGKITNNATPLYVYVGDAAPTRGMVFNCQLTGPGNILLDAKANAAHYMELNNETNNFTGQVYTDTGTIYVDTPKSLGNCSALTIGNTGQLVLKADVQVVNCAMNLFGNGKLNLDHNFRVGSARIAGVDLQNNTYTAAQLAALYPNNIINGGGTLTVGTPVPRLAVNPSGTTVTFSNLNVMIQAGDKTTQTVTLTNSGNLDLNFLKQGSETYQGLVLSGSSLYKIKSVTPATSAPLAPGGVVTVTLEFSGATTADYLQGGNNAKAATLDIFSDATGMPKYTIKLAGSTTVPVQLSNFSAQ